MESCKKPFLHIRWMWLTLTKTIACYDINYGCKKFWSSGPDAKPIKFNSSSLTKRPNKLEFLLSGKSFQPSLTFASKAKLNCGLPTAQKRLGADECSSLFGLFIGEEKSLKTFATEVQLKKLCAKISCSVCLWPTISAKPSIYEQSQIPSYFVSKAILNRSPDCTEKTWRRRTL